MKKREPISKIMTKSVITANINDSLHEVKHQLSKHKIRHIPILRGKDLVGILSHNDIMRLSFGTVFDGQEDADDAIFDMLTIPQVMAHNPRTVLESDTIQDVAQVFAAEHFHALPVLDQDGILVGIVTTTDVIKYLLELY